MRSFEEIRQSIDEIDEGIRALYARRLAVVEEVALHKLQSGGVVHDPAREARIMEKLERWQAEGLFGITQVYRAMLRVSREYQYGRLIEEGAVRFPFPVSGENAAPAVVYYQGVDGSYSSRAARLLYPGVPLEAVRTFPDVVQAVLSHPNAVGVLPIDNTTEGSVGQTYDLMLANDVHIVRAVTIPATHCLLGVQGAAVSDIQRVYSHPQALAQCGAFLRTLGAEPAAASNTAVAAKQVAEAGDKTSAALASREAAEKYGLAVLRENVQDAADNATRFVALSRVLTAGDEADTVSLVLQLPHESGSLAGALAIFADYGVNLTKIQSRPVPDCRWNYSFYLDFNGRLSSPQVRGLLYQLYCEYPYVKLLGFYSQSDVTL